MRWPEARPGRYTPVIMQILLSNDDGIFAPGLAGLHAALRDLGETTVIAPETARSAAGHAITIHKPLVVQHVPIRSNAEFAGISVDGNPADCVRLAIRSLLAHMPDLVCTGINAGANVGVNVFYSGTVAGAAEAAMLGIPAVAFSADTSARVVDYEQVGVLCRWVLDRLLTAELRPGDLVNVNIPPLEDRRPLGVRVVPQSTVELEDRYHHRLDETGRSTYRLGPDFGFAEGDHEADVDALAAGYITVTPLRVDMTNYPRMETLESLPWHLPSA